MTAGLRPALAALAALLLVAGCADPRGVDCGPLSPGFPLCGL